MTWLDRLLLEKQPVPVLVIPRVFDPTLEALCAGLPLEDALELREERAAIFEYEAGFSHAEAERWASGSTTPPHRVLASQAPYGPFDPRLLARYD